MKLLITKTSPYVRKVCVLADEKHLELEKVVTPPWEQSPLLVQNNPLGKVPVLIDDNGQAIFASNVIVDYLDKKSGGDFLIPTDAQQRAEVNTVGSVADGIVDAVAAVLMAGFVDEEYVSAKWSGWQFRKAVKSLVWLEGHAYAGSYFCLGRLTMADISLACALDFIGRRAPQLQCQKQCPVLLSCYEMLMRRSAFAENLSVLN